MSKRDKARRPQVIIDLAEYERLKGAHLREDFASGWNEIRSIVPSRYWGSNSVRQIVTDLVADAQLWQAYVNGDPIHGAPSKLLVEEDKYNALKADAELGALVRRMPKESSLIRYYPAPNCPEWRVQFPSSSFANSTPEAALKIALGEE